MKQNVFFVSGIDTDAGKSYATGFLAREWNKNGQRTITQKFIQTGNVGHSEDIDLHRRIMGISFTKEDEEGLTMPEIFSYPASPHLASQLDNRPIDFNKIKRATKKLSERYDYVLLNHRTADNRLHCPREISAYLCHFRQTGEYQSHLA